jgi:hypothetical protein
VISRIPCFFLYKNKECLITIIILLFVSNIQSHDVLSTVEHAEYASGSGHVGDEVRIVRWGNLPEHWQREECVRGRGSSSYSCFSVLVFLNDAAGGGVLFPKSWSLMDDEKVEEYLEHHGTTGSALVIRNELLHKSSKDDDSAVQRR